MYHFLFIHWPLDGHLNGFHLLALVSHAAMNIGVQVCVQVSASSSLGYIPRNGIAGSYGNSMFQFLRNCQNVFYSD